MIFWPQRGAIPANALKRALAIDCSNHIATRHGSAAVAGGPREKNYRK
jgi:hypothetical protein